MRLSVLVSIFLLLFVLSSPFFSNASTTVLYYNERAFGVCPDAYSFTTVGNSDRLHGTSIETPWTIQNNKSPWNFHGCRINSGGVKSAMEQTDELHG